MAVLKFSLLLFFPLTYLMYQYKLVNGRKGGTVSNTTRIIKQMDLLEIKKQHVSAYHWPSSGFILK